MKKIIFLIIFLFLGIINNFQSLNAQLSIDNTKTTLQIAQSIAGPGVTVLNPIIRGVQALSGLYQVGTFTTATSTKTQMGFSGGIILTTGNTSAVPLTLGINPKSPANITGKYPDCTANLLKKGGDCSAAAAIASDINTLANNATWYDAAMLEFDFIPICDNFSFRYIFGSEEYDNGFNNYQCTDFNDMFGFLISGPGIVGGQGYANNAKNLAVLANGSRVTINSVNNGVAAGDPGNCSSANPAWTENSPTSEYLGQIDGTNLNGNTKILTAKQTNLIPGQTYHIKFIIMDIQDGALDAVVYLETGSFTSPGLNSTQKTIKNGVSSATSILTEGCTTGEMEITLNPTSASVFPLAYTVTGNATNGTDYTNLSGTTSIPANQASTILTINPTTDLITENIPETVIITASTCTGSTSKTFTIVEPLIVTCSSTSNSITFNWNNNGATLYNYSYSISGANAITGNTASGVTTFTVPSLTSGKSVTITITPSFGVLGDGCLGTSTCSITGCTSPAAPVVTSPVSYCQNDIASALSATALSGNTLKWYGTAQTGGTSSPSVTMPLTTTVGQTTYYVSQTTSDGCESTRSPIVVDIKAKPTITVNSPTICANQTAALTASGATTYSWDVVGGATGISTSASFTTPQLTSNTSYTVTGTTSGCTGTATAAVTVASNLSITVNSPTICANQTATLNASGATSSSWDIVGGATGVSTSASFTTPQLTSNTSYKVTGTTSGCTGTATAVVTVNANPSITVNSPTICANQTATLNASGATSYSWDIVGGATGVSTSASFTTPQLTSNTSYKVTGTTSGCTGTATAVVTVNPNPTITVNSPTICANQTATLNASGATTYSWDVVGGATGISTAATYTTPQLNANTSYLVTGTTLGCTGTATALVTNVANLTITVNSPSICINQTATLTASGATTYSWDQVGGSNGISISANFTTPQLTTNTSYKVTGTTSGCTGTATAIVTVLPNLTITVNSPTICSGRSANLSASGATTYSWDQVGGATAVSNSASFTTPLLTTNTSYIVTGTTSGCTGTATSIVTVNPTPTVTVNSPTICNGQSATLNAIGSTTYTWDQVGGNNGISTSPTFTSSNLTSNTSYVVTGAIGSCTNSATSTVTVTPLINIVVNSPAICSGNSATISVSGANTYIWSDGSTENPLIVSPTSTTTYTVIGSIGTCTGTGSSTVTVNETPLLVIGTPPSGCAPKKVDLKDPSLTIGSTTGSTFQYWVNASGTLPLSAPSSVGNGTYYISNTKNGCSSTPIAVPVVINPIPIAQFTPSPYLVSTISPECRMINQSIGAIKYLWDFGDGGVSEEINPTHTFSDSDTASYIIKLIANTTLGCSDTIAKKVKVYEELIYFVPNTFTPDQDNFNNTFQPVFVSGFDPYSFTMTIFNRWGEMVFETHDSKIGWKGTYGVNNTELAKEGVYTWKIEFSLKSDDRRKQITGIVNLIK